MKTIFIILFSFSSLIAQVAQVSAISGEVELIRANEVLELKVSDYIKEKDVIKTSNNGKIQLLFEDESIVTLGKNSSFKIDEYLYKEEKKNVKTKLKFYKGAFRVITGKIGKIAPSKFKLETQSATMGIRGTQILMNLDKQNEKIACVEGEIFVVTLDNKTIDLKAGESIDIDVLTNKIKRGTLNNSDLDSTVISSTSNITNQNDTSSYDNFLNKYNELVSITNAINDNFNKGHIVQYNTSVSGYIEEVTDGTVTFDNDALKKNNATFDFEIDFGKGRTNNPVEASFTVITPSTSSVRQTGMGNAFTGNFTNDNKIVLEFKNDSNVDASKRTLEFKNSNLDIEAKNIELRTHAQDEKIIIEDMTLTPK